MSEVHPVCVCQWPGRFVDVACLAEHDDTLPAKCPCGALWPPGTWSPDKYPACHSCGGVCVTCCHCEYNREVSA